MVVLRYFTSQVVRARKPNLTTTRREREQACTAVPETPVLVPFVSFSFYQNLRQFYSLVTTATDQGFFLQGWQIKVFLNRQINLLLLTITSSLYRFT